MNRREFIGTFAAAAVAAPAIGWADAQGWEDYVEEWTDSARRRDVSSEIGNFSFTTGHACLAAMGLRPGLDVFLATGNGRRHFGHVTDVDVRGSQVTVRGRTSPGLPVVRAIHRNCGLSYRINSSLRA